MKNVLNLAAVAALVATTAAGGIVIGDGSCEVVVAENASPVVRFAADELTNFLFRATGERLPVRTAFSEGKSAIVLGTNAWSRAAGIDPAKEPRDTFFIRSAGSRLYVCGNDDPKLDPAKMIERHRSRSVHFGERATLFGVYEYLERFAGVRFYFPGELGTVVPRRGRIAVPETDLRVTPAMSGRSVSLGLTWYETDGMSSKGELSCSPGEVLNWFRLRLETDRVPFGHGQNGFNLVGRFKDSHPEYFRMSKEGTRDFDLKVTKDHPFYKTRQLCHTSGVWEEMYQDVRSYFRGEPPTVRGVARDGWGAWSPFHGRYVNIMPQDALQRCYCANCRKTLDYDDPNFVNEIVWSNTVSIANRLKAEGFDAVMTQMAYRPYGMPPKVEIPENVEVMAAETGPWVVGDPETLEMQVRHVESWYRKLGRKLFLWTYACKACWLTPPNAPCVAPRAVGTFYRRVAPWVKGVFNQGPAERYFYQYLNYYVFSKLAWDPGTDVDALLSEHHRLLFGPAAGPMAKFYDELERIWIGEVAIPGIIPEVLVARKSKQPTKKRLYTEIYSAKRLDGLEALLREAEVLVAPDSLEAKRIALVRRELFDPIAVPARELQAAEGLSGSGSRTVLKETFDDGDAAKRWVSLSRGGFRIADGAGLDGSRGLVLEYAKTRPVPKAGETITVEGNAVLPLPTGGRETFMRELPVEPGRTYSFSVMLKGAITNNCAYLFFAWYDKDGKMLGKAGGTDAIYKKVGTKGWEKWKSGTQRMPSEAVRAELYLEIYRTTLGRMQFDDFEVVASEVVHADRMFSSAYRDAADGGPVRFLVPYVAAPAKYPREKVFADFAFDGADGKPFTVRAPASADGRCVETTVDAARLAAGTHPVTATLRCGETTLATCSLAFTRADVARKVRFDRLNCMIVDGKPFLALGVYVHPADRELAYLDRLKGSPFNCVIECGPRRETLDKVRAAGLRAIPRAPWQLKDARAAARGLRDHPALLAWYTIDEASVDRAGEKRAVYEAIRSEDADHPTIAVLDYPRNTDAFLGAYDILAPDPYPIGHRGQPIGITAEYPVQCRERTYGLRPIWQVPQAFAWDWCHKYGYPKEDRYPTYEELRSMAWQAIAGGANGLLWYAASQIFKNSPPEDLERNWGDLVKVAEEIRGYEAVILSDGSAPQVRSESPDIAARAFSKDGKVWLLAVNKTKEPVSGVVDIPGVRRGKVSLPALGFQFKELRAQAAAR